MTASPTRTADSPRAREMRWLVGAARRFVGIGDDDDRAGFLAAAPGWDALLARAEREGMTGLVGAALEGLARAGAPGLPLERWRAATRAVAASNLSALGELAALRAALRRERRQVVLLKGAALLREHYRGDVGLRPLGDIDLLVRPSDMPALTGWLRGRGYEPFAPSSGYFSRGVVAFDLHLDVVGGERVGRKARVFRLDPEALWREAAPLEADDPTALVLAPVHQGLHLAVHALKHSYSRLIWLVDLALVLRDAPWGPLLEEARACGVLRPLGYALALLDALLGIASPSGVRGAPPALNALERSFVRLVAQRSGVETPGDLMVALSIPGVIGKTAYLAELVVPARQVLMRHYPRTPRWLLYPRRAVRLLSLGVREGSKLVRRALP